VIERTPVVTLECIFDGVADLDGRRMEAVQKQALAEHLAVHPEHKGAAFVYVTRSP
jgi:hypothetical protein